MTSEEPHGCSASRLRVAVVSDLHAYEGDIHPPPSRLQTGDADANPLTHPIAGLEQLIDENHLRTPTDLLLCPGDLGNAAQRAGVLYGWSTLQRLRHVLGEPDVIATVGNHDVSSRPTESQLQVDATETLRGLEPLYPFDDRGVQQAYFSDHFAIISRPEVRIVTLNTSAHHARGQREYDHGRVTSSTRQRLMRDLKRQGHVALNILLCHHHPIEYTAVDEPDRSTIVGGALLMKSLVEHDLGPWVIVHGHKHVPNLAYAPGGGNSPAVFSAGSLSAAFHMNQQPITRNQFYWLEFDPDATGSVGTGLACRFWSWYWVPGRGWIPTDPGSGLPAQGGFGVRGDPRQLAEAVRRAVTESGRPSLAWCSLREAYPPIEFLIPDDLGAVAAELERGGWSVRTDTSGRYEEVARPWP